MTFWEEIVVAALRAVLTADPDLDLPYAVGMALDCADNILREQRERVRDAEALARTLGSKEQT